MIDDLGMRLAALDPHRFERLIFALALAEHGRGREHEVRPLRPPDGGADILLVSDARGQPQAFQAKRFTKKIKWRDCEESLESARGHYGIRGMRFVFPIDLTAGQVQTFERLASRYPDVVVDYWSLGHLEELLARHPTVRRRFLGDETTTLVERLDRMAAAGGKLESATDAVERARTIGEFLAGRDPDFDTQMMTGTTDAPAPDWARPPYVIVRLEAERDHVTFAAWARDDADVPQPVFGFTDDEVGDEARMLARVELASGRGVVLSRGIWIGLRAPAVLRELRAVAEGPDFSPGQVVLDETAQGGVRLDPGEPVTLELVADPRGRRLSRSVSAYPVIPDEPGTAEVAAIDDGITLTLTLKRVEHGTDFSLGIGWVPTAGDARVLRAAAEFVQATREGVSLTVEGKPLVERGSAVGLEESDLAARLEVWLELYDDVLFLEEHAGVKVPLPPPEEWTQTDADAIATASDALRRRRGTGQFERGSIVVTADEVPAIAERLLGERVVREVDYRIFGRRVVIGRGAYTLPRLKVADIQPVGVGPRPPARVWLAARGDPSMQFELVA